MNKTKLIIHERFNGKQSLEDVFLSAFQSESYQLLQDNSSSIMNSTEQSQDSFGYGTELQYETERIKKFMNDDIIYIEIREMKNVERRR